MDSKYNFIELYMYLSIIKNTKKCIKIYNQTMIEKKLSVVFLYLNIIFVNERYKKQ